MRILVAGGAGYIGSSVVPALLARGHDVHVVDLLWFGNHLPPGTRVMQRDVLDLAGGDVTGYDTVIFLAGLSNDPMAEFSPSRNFVANAAAPAYLAYLAKRGGARRYIYAGSCSVYGYTDNSPFDEDSPAVSTFPYGISKLQGEKAALQLCDDAFSVIVLRQGTVSGYSPRMRLDLIVNAMFRSAVGRGEIVVNNPAIWRPVLGMEDAVRAYAAAVEAPSTVSGVFNVASGNWTVGEVADVVRERLRAALGRDIALTTLQRPDVRNYKVSTAKAARALGLAPQHGIADIVADLLANRERFSDLDNPNYDNIAVFRALAGASSDAV